MKIVSLLIIASIGQVYAQTFSPGWTDLGHQTQINGPNQDVCPADHFGYTTSIGYVGAGTSATPQTITSSGTLTWTTQAGLPFITLALANQALVGTTGYIRVFETSNPSKWMQGQVHTGGYVGTSLQLDISSSGGTGTGITDWTLTPGLPFQAVKQSSLGATAIIQADYDFNALCGNVVVNSNGATIDTKRGTMFVWGGGHGGSGGNEVYMINPQATPPTTTRVNNPSIFDNPYSCNALEGATDLAIDATDPTKITSSSYSFTSADDYCQINIYTVGTGLVIGFYQIMDAAGGAAYLDRSAGTVGATGGSWWETHQEQYPSDGFPVPRHTYNQTQYISSIDRMWTWEGPGYGGPIMRNTWEWDPATLLWKDMTMQASYNGGQKGCVVSNCVGQPYYDITSPTLNPSSGGATCGYDVAQDRVVCVWGNNLQLVQYTPSTNSWQQLTLNSSFCMGLSACNTTVFTSVIDQLFHNWLFVGGSSASSPSTSVLHAYQVSLSIGSTYATQDLSANMAACGGTNNYPTTTLGAGMNVSYPGLAYDPKSQTVVGYPWEGNTTYVFDLMTQTCHPEAIYTSPVLPAPGYTNPPTEGIFGRFGYIPQIGGFVLLTNVNNDAFQYVRGIDSLQGLGHSYINSSSVPCLDIDGDGYGVGAACLGPDADDFDAAVWTPAQVIAKYGSIQTFLQSKGYQSTASPAPVYCIDATNGNDTTGAANTNADTACLNTGRGGATAFATWGGVYVHFEPAGVPAVILFRTGTYTNQIKPLVSGTATQPVVIMSYPGEQMIEDYSAHVGDTVNIANLSWVILTNLRIKANASGDGIDGGTGINYGTGSQTILFFNDIIQFCEISGAGTDSNIHADNMYNIVVQYNVLHDPTPSGGQHNWYGGSNTQPSFNVKTANNIGYNVLTGNYPNFQWNGRCTNCLWDNNWLFNQDGQGLAFLNGVSYSVARNNVIWNTGSTQTGGSGSTIALTMAAQDTVCQQIGAASICGYNQNYNVIENNTFWAGTKDIVNGGTIPGAPIIKIAENNTQNSSGGACIVCGTTFANTFRNNLVIGLDYVPTVGYSAVGTHPASYYAGQDTYINNIFNGTAGSPTANFGLAAGSGAYTDYTCAQWSTTALVNTGCSTASPLFTSVNVNFWNAPQSFNFAPTTGSPAINVSTTPDAVEPAIFINGTARPKGNLQVTLGAVVPASSPSSGGIKMPTAIR